MLYISTWCDSDRSYQVLTKILIKATQICNYTYMFKALPGGFNNMIPQRKGACDVTHTKFSKCKCLYLLTLLLLLVFSEPFK